MAGEPLTGTFAGTMKVPHTFTLTLTAPDNQLYAFLWDGSTVLNDRVLPMVIDGDGTVTGTHYLYLTVTVNTVVNSAPAAPPLMPHTYTITLNGIPYRSGSITTGSHDLLLLPHGAVLVITGYEPSDQMLTWSGAGGSGIGAERLIYTQTVTVTTPITATYVQSFNVTVPDGRIDVNPDRTMHGTTGVSLILTVNDPLYRLPTNMVSITMADFLGGYLTYDIDYTFDRATGTIVINAMITGHIQITVTAELIPIHDVNVNVSHSTGDSSGTVKDEELLVVILTPNTGYDLPSAIDVTMAGTAGPLTLGLHYNYVALGDGRYTFTMLIGVTGDLTITGTSELKTYTVSVIITEGDYEFISDLKSPNEVNHFSTLVIQIKPNEGYNIPVSVTVKVGGIQTSQYSYDSSTGILNIYITGGPLEIEADCPIKTYTITVPAERSELWFYYSIGGVPQGKIPADGLIRDVPHFSQIEISFGAKGGYTFLWKDGTATTSFMVDSPKTLEGTLKVYITLPSSSFLYSNDGGSFVPVPGAAFTVDYGSAVMIRPAPLSGIFVWNGNTTGDRNLGVVTEPKALEDMGGEVRWQATDRISLSGLVTDGTNGIPWAQVNYKLSGGVLAEEIIMGKVYTGADGGYEIIIPKGATLEITSIVKAGYKPDSELPSAFEDMTEDVTEMNFVMSVVTSPGLFDDPMTIIVISALAICGGTAAVFFRGRKG
jgi:hypothetical protein